MAVRIITDSAGDLSQEYANSLGIQVLPLRVRFGDEEFLDGVTIMPPELIISASRPSTRSVLTPFSTCSGFLTEILYSAPRHFRTASNPSHSAGMQGSTVSVSNPGRMPSMYRVAA